MKLQKQLSRRIGNKEYPKWIVTIPPSKVRQLGWKAGEELETVIEENKLILKSKNE